jgi:putative acetyltransferase
MHIRKSTKDDQSVIAELIRETIETVNASDYSPEQTTTWSDRITMERLIERHENVIQFVAEDDGRIVGMGDISVPDEEIDFLYVRKDSIGTGVGSEILSHLEDEARKSGLQTLSVTSSITAKPFFVSRGFTHVKEAQRSLPGAVFTVYILRKNL